MAPIAITSVDRRSEPRHAGGGARYGCRAVLRPGQPVTIVNITTRGALVESDSRLRPGAYTEMQLSASDRRASIKGRLDRCYVAALEPIRYRGVVLFEQALDL
jgi:hypothetical protein